MVVRRQVGSRLPVKNRRLVDTALNTMKNLYVANSENVANAVEATGFPITLYNRLRVGKRCTCSFQSKRVLDESGNLPEDKIDLLLGTDSGLVDYASDTKYKEVKGTNVEVVYRENVNSQVSNMTGSSAFSDQDPDMEDLDASSFLGEGPQELEDDDDLSDDGNSLDDFRLRLSRSDSNACGLCFGTTIAGGYELFHGQRVCLSTVDDPTIQSGSIEIQESPNRIVLAPGGSCEWDIVISASSKWAMYPHLYDNTNRVVNGYTIEYWNSTAWVELTDPMVLATGAPSSIRVRALNEDSTEQGLEFSHLEFLYSFRDQSDPMKADFPIISRLQNISLADALSSTSIIVAGEYLINPLSIVIDHLPNVSRHWMVSSAQPRRDQFGRQYDTTMEARNSDLNELNQLLRPLDIEREPLV
jgi:hypothetical protein